MSENPSQPKADQITYDYSVERVRVLYGLREKPADMTDHEWAIVSDEGFRQYIATQLGIPYVSRQSQNPKP